MNDYAQQIVTTADTLIRAHQDNDSETFTNTLDTLPRTLAQDVITALLLRLDPQEHDQERQDDDR